MRDPSDGGGLGRFRHGHLDLISIASVLLVYTVTESFFDFPTRMAKLAQTAAWSVPLFSGVLSSLWLTPLVYVLWKHRGKNILEITKELAGNVGAFTFGIVLFLLNTGVVSAGARQLSEALSTVVVPLTPITFIVTALWATGFWLALKGTEVLGRLAIIAAVGIVVHVTLLSTLTLNVWRIDEIYPLLGPGIPGLLKAYGVGQGMYAELLAIGMLAPYLRRRSDLGKAALAGGGLSSAILVLVTLTSLMMFPYPSLTRIHIPFLRSIRIIHLSRFLQRFDVFFVVLWLSAGSLLVAIGACLNSHVIAFLTGTGSYRIGVLVSGALILAGALVLPSLADTMVIHGQVIRPYSIVLLYGWPVTLLLLQIFKGNKKQDRSVQTVTQSFEPDHGE